ncbi:MAG TPA: transcription antitermination factor NusB [Candidatus Krumholzibacteria bacterium]|nr:transcription antitermination factor NusB [Candidatus Krumholzibacteria bacterium]
MNSARRRKARELLVQALYSCRVGGRPLPDAIVDQVERRRPHTETLQYVRELEPLLDDQLQALDARIDEFVQGRAAERVGAVERAILQLGLVELMHRDDIPVAVVIDESQHLVETFSTSDSVRFVQGVLDRLAREVRPA